MRYLIVLAVFTCSAFAEVGLQDDWSGGFGVHGPVSDWSNEFSSSAMINWSDLAGSLILGQMSSYHLISQLSYLVWAKPCHLSNDQFPDLFVRSDGYQNACWYMQEAGGTQWYRRDVSHTDNIVDVSTADIDGGGGIDIFASVQSCPNRGFVWYERLNAVGDQWQLHQIDTESSSDRVLAVDMDNDGDFDLVGLYGGNVGYGHDISWWENQNNGTTWLKHVISENAGAKAMTSIDIADCDNDGDPDIACGSLTDSLYIFENTPGESWVVHVVSYISPGEMRDIAFADIDQDGLPDLVTHPHYYTSDVLWFRNTGNPSDWTVNVIPTNAGKALWAFPGDVDGDGDPDILVKLRYGSRNGVFWLENIDPLDGAWIQHEAFQDSSIAGCYAADINTDGLTDIVAYYRYRSSPVLNKAGWWNLNSICSTDTAQLESSILCIDDVDRDSIDWSAETPTGTSVAFQVRASDDPSSMGDWSPVITSPGSIASYLASEDSYVQYRAILSTTDPEVTPVLDNVVLTWTTTGIEGSAEESE